MTQREKIDAALEYLKKHKIRGSNAAPLFFRLCWALGWFIPPPHFLGFISVALLTGTMFGVLMAGVACIVVLTSGGQVGLSHLLVGLACGSFYGLSIAAHYRWSARRMGLPAWSDFSPDEPTDDTW